MLKLLLVKFGHDLVFISISHYTGHNTAHPVTNHMHAYGVFCICERECIC